MNPRAIRGWLMQAPRPTMLRLDGEQEMRPHRSFQKTAESIDALDPDLVEAIDKEGKIIRALSLKESAPPAPDRAVIPEELKADPQALMLTHFADLIHRAYSHSTEIAFDKMIELVQRLGDRSDSIEQRLERAERDNRKAHRDLLDEAYERAMEQAERTAAEGAEGDLSQQLATAFIGGQGIGKPPVKAPRRPPNGKADE